MTSEKANGDEEEEKKGDGASSLAVVDDDADHPGNGNSVVTVLGSCQVRTTILFYIGNDDADNYDTIESSGFVSGKGSNATRLGNHDGAGGAACSPGGVASPF